MLGEIAGGQGGWGGMGGEMAGHGGNAGVGWDGGVFLFVGIDARPIVAGCGGRASHHTSACEPARKEVLYPLTLWKAPLLSLPRLGIPPNVRLSRHPRFTISFQPMPHMRYVGRILWAGALSAIRPCGGTKLGREL